MKLPKIFLLFYFFIILTLCFSIVSPVFSQNELKDYQYQSEKYSQAYDDYIKARDAYLTYETLTSRDELITAARDFLYTRAIVMRTYFQILKVELKKAPDVEATQKEYLILSLDSWINWLMDSEEEIKNLQNPTLVDLLEISKRFEKNQNTFSKFAYQTLSNIILGKMRLLQSEATSINFLLADKISENGGTKDVVTLNQWMQTVKNMTYQSQKNIEQAEAYLAQLNSSSKTEQNFELYKQIQQELEKMQYKLLNAIDYQKEILREVESE